MQVADAVMSFFFLFALAFIAVALALAALGLDFMTSASGAAAALANVGPGVGDVIGPSGTFAPMRGAKTTPTEPRFFRNSGQVRPEPERPNPPRGIPAERRGIGAFTLRLRTR